MASRLVVVRTGLNAGLVAIAREAPNRSHGDVTGSPFPTQNRQRIADTMKP